MLALKTAAQALRRSTTMTVRRWSVAGAASFSTTRYRTPHDTPMSDMEIIRISERIVTPGYEETVKEVMEKVEHQVRRQDGLVEIETLVDAEDPNAYSVITRWENSKKLQKWLDSDLCREVSERINTVLDKPPTYREFCKAEEDIFLL